MLENKENNQNARPVLELVCVQGVSHWAGGARRAGRASAGGWILPAALQLRAEGRREAEATSEGNI